MTPEHTIGMLTELLTPSHTFDASKIVGLRRRLLLGAPARWLIGRASCFEAARQEYEATIDHAHDIVGINNHFCHGSIH